ncbi:hypothetical protein E8E12_002261 [Didymella heteroderae]|uniref:Uncharacterized protein n=1 Tax=Didymella heteroderae TaxID=1769908 RepID=A0A9P5BV67_9PLEO|nr:hypothetical protein E8E12_002261 [Didymella heteroderae]
MNLLVKNLKEGKITSIKWGQINDPRKGLDTSKDPAQLAKQENEAILVQQDAEVAAMDNKGQFDPRNYSVYNAFNERKVQREREEDEQRRVEAAERKSRITGKSTKKKKVADEDGVPPLPDIPRKGFGKSILKFGKRSNKPDASKWAELSLQVVAGFESISPGANLEFFQGFPLSSTAMVFLQLNNMFVAAYPVEKVVNMARDDAPAVTLGEHADHRTIIVVLCMCYAFLLALAQGYRAGRMAGQKTSARFSDMLVFAQGFVSTAFVFAVGINNAGLGLSTDRQCHSAIRVCIAMYGAAKIALYLFLLERVHIVRAPFIERVKDPVWVFGAILTVVGWAAITAYDCIGYARDELADRAFDNGNDRRIAADQQFRPQLLVHGTRTSAKRLLDMLMPIAQRFQYRVVSHFHHAQDWPTQPDRLASNRFEDLQQKCFRYQAAL